MAVLSKEEFLAAVNARVGESTSDDDLKFLEDMTDTINSVSGDGEDWKAKYEQNDSEWRRKYRERFMGAGGETPGGQTHETDTDIVEETEAVDVPAGAEIQIDDLFEEV